MLITHLRGFRLVAERFAVWKDSTDDPYMVSGPTNGYADRLNEADIDEDHSVI